MPLPALMVDVMLDPVPASVRLVCITVLFEASSLLCCAQPSPSASVSLQKSSVTAQGRISVPKPSHLHNIYDLSVEKVREIGLKYILGLTVKVREFHIKRHYFYSDKKMQ